MIHEFTSTDFARQPLWPRFGRIDVGDGLRYGPTAPGAAACEW